MGTLSLSQGREMRVLSVGVAAVASLYLLVVFVAEPMRSLASNTANTVVTYNVTSALSLTCSDSTIGTAAGNGTSGTGAQATASCTPITNDALGYTLSWLINTSSGTSVCSGNCDGTGHLLSTNVTGGLSDKILAYDRQGSHINEPAQFDSTTILSGSGSRWAARLRGNSTTTDGASVAWGSDGATEGFLNVATGSAVNIAKRTTETDPAGDIENFLFKVVIPSGTFQPTGTYKATILFTATDN